MGRAEKRALKREYMNAGVPEELAKRISEATTLDKFAEEDMEDGTRVMINYSRVLANTNDKLDSYCKFVYENRYCIFKTKKTNMNGVYQLTRSNEENPWLFHYSDLIMIY